MSLTQYEYKHRLSIGFILFFLIIYGSYVEIGVLSIQTMRIVGGMLVWYFIYLTFTNKLSKMFLPIFHLLFGSCHVKNHNI